MPRWVKALPLVLFLAGLVLAIGFLAYQRVRLLYLQRECMNFSAPATAVVFEPPQSGAAPPARAAGFVDSGGTIARDWFSPVVSQSGFGNALLRWPSVPLTTRTPHCFDAFASMVSVNPIVTAFASLPDSVPFAHWRVSRKGTGRLVVIMMAFGGYDWWWDATIVPGTLIRNPLVKISHPTWPSNDEMHGIHSPTFGMRRFFAGQIDPADGSHFTIGYQWNDGVRGTIDGWLQDDGSVRLQVRPGPGDVTSEEARLRSRQGHP